MLCIDLRKTCLDLLRLALHRFALPGLGQTCFAEICFAWTCSDLLCIDLRKTCLDLSRLALHRFALAGFALAGSAAGASRQASSGEQFWSSSIVEKTCVGLPKLALEPVRHTWDSDLFKKTCLGLPKLA